LAALAERYPLVACTNGNADVFKTPLAPYFSASIRSEEAGAAKPATTIFEQTCKAVSVSPSALAHIGDNATTDVLGSQVSGCLGVWYNPERADWPHADEPAPHAEVVNYDELQTLLGV
ncbi:MAG: HAD-IA family hydrolase, partial [Pseudomonadota bacterium]